MGGSDGRGHVIGKGIIRFHAVYWPAMLLSSGGQKVSKSAGNAEDPADLATRYGTEVLRWWMLREVARAGDTDYTAERLIARANEDLANNLGNLVNRTVSMVNRYRDGVIPAGAADNPAAGALCLARSAAAATIDTTCRDIAEHLQPFLPTAADRITAQCGNGGPTAAQPSPVFPRLGSPTT